jgi:hypothetical protein
MKCKVEQDLNNHLRREEMEEAKESLVDETADHIIEDLERFDELFAEEEVNIAAIKYIHDLITKKRCEEVVHDWRILKDAIKKQARITAVNDIKGE